MLVTKFKKYIQELIFSDCAKDNFLYIKLVYFCFIVIQIHYSLKPNFRTHSLQIHCIGLFRPRFFLPFGLRYQIASLQKVISVMSLNENQQESLPCENIMIIYFIFAYVVLITHILVKICLMGWSYKTPLLYHI